MDEYLDYLLQLQTLNWHYFVYVIMLIAILCIFGLYWLDLIYKNEPKSATLKITGTKEQVEKLINAITPQYEFAEEIKENKLDTNTR